MAAPFELMESPRPTLVYRLLRRVAPSNVLVEINNLLARAERINDLDAKEFAAITAKYGFDVRRRFPNETRGFYERYLRYCLLDKAITEQEVEALHHLKVVLGIPDRALAQIHSDVVVPIYGQSVDEAIDDGRLGESEREFLKKLQTELRLSDETAHRICEEKARTFVSGYWDQITADRRLSPQEEHEAREIAKSLGVSTAFDEHQETIHAKLRILWLVENGEGLPSSPVDINLQAKETCHLTREASWYEHRSVTKRFRYAGPAVRIKIVKGLYWRMGDYAVQRVAKDVLTKVDSGTLYLTNKRLLLVGVRRNMSIRLTDILDFDPYKNGIRVHRASGKSPFLEFQCDMDIFEALLKRLLRDTRQ